MGGALGRSESSRSGSPESKLEAKMVEAMQRRALEGTSMKSFNSIIMKFPKIDESLRNCKTIFEQFENYHLRQPIKLAHMNYWLLRQALRSPNRKLFPFFCRSKSAKQAQKLKQYPKYVNKSGSNILPGAAKELSIFDEDSNGAIDPEELKHCFQELEFSSTEDEISDLFKACDINESMGIKFNEFIVLLCLVYLLKEPQEKSKMGFPNLEATFETLVDAFVFLDKNKDGYVSKNEMVHAINETTSGERSSGRIAMKRFEEMDWDKNGMVTFKEFLFAFTRWVGIDDVEDDDD